MPELFFAIAPFDSLSPSLFVFSPLFLACLQKISLFQSLSKRLNYFSIIQSSEAMKHQNNPLNFKRIQSHINPNKSGELPQHKEQSKLYSSERLPFHQGVSPHVTTQDKPELSATQLYFNLNHSLQGLFSKIEALKQQHTIQQKAPKQMKKINMDVSNFPMPNLTVNNFPSGKQLPAPHFLKSKEMAHEQYQLPVKATEENRKWENTAFNLLNIPNLSRQGSKVIENSKKQKSFSSRNMLEQEGKKNSPLSEAVSNNYDYIKNAQPKQLKKQSPVTETTSFHESAKNISAQKKQKIQLKQPLVKGLLNISNSHMKVSMEVFDEKQLHANLNKKNNFLQLEDIIEKSTQQTDVLKASMVFHEKVQLKDFEVGKNIGSGKFGDVHICRHKATGAIFALKKIFKSTILQYNMVTQFTRELRIHYQLDHPNIIKLYTHFDDEYHIFLLMEYAQGGILMNKLKCFQDAASKLVDQTIDAVQYLHKLKIAHRDIKPENIVLQFGDVVKLCDFGWASFYDNEMKTTFCGTLDYLSPEMREGNQYDNSVDIWSIGVLTFQLLTGNPPYRKQLMQSMKNSSRSNSKKVNWNVNYPSFISPLAESFMRNLLKQNPEERATLRFCSTHTFIKKYRQNMEDSMHYIQFEQVLKKVSEKAQNKNQFLLHNWNPLNNSTGMMETVNFNRTNL